MFTRSPGQPSQRPSYFSALAAQQNVGAANGGILLGVYATNEAASGVAYLSVADATGTLYKIAVPAQTTVPIRSLNDGRIYNGQLSVTPTSALDVTVEIA